MAKTQVIGISAVEKETGLSKDSLRVWERRYGFPRPSRDARGERQYPPDQVEKLRLIRRLMDAGHRPGLLMEGSLEDLRRLGSPRQSNGPVHEHAEEVAALMRLVEGRDIVALRAQLRWHLLRLGLHDFVMGLLAEINAAVGDAWASDRITVAEEHLYSEQVERTLRHAIGEISVPARGPRILLTSLPGEEHGLGLLMLEAVLVVELAECFPLGTQTPAGSIVSAAVAAKVEVVALSFSSSYPKRTALEALDELRAALPRHIQIWAGGEGVAGLRRCPDGVILPMALADAATRVRDWER